MNWSTAHTLKAQLSRLWERGDLLRPLVTDEIAGEAQFPQFPLRLALKGPSSSELTGRFDEVRTWIADLIATPRIRIEWRTLNHRVHGMQQLPAAAWLDSRDDALGLIGKRRDAEKFVAILAMTRPAHVALLPWLSKRPLQAIELVDAWPRLLAVVSWMTAHPRPGIYLRQVDIPEVDSKFIEAQRGILAELFDLVLPATAIAADHTGRSQFAARYGFLDKPTRIRLRVLDTQICLVSGAALPDVTLDAESFGKLNAPIRHVFITENEINFLALPPVPEAIVVFGAGYGWDALSTAAWLQRCSIYYWGDIDTHGFAILDQLRRQFPRVTSFLMDRPTLMAHQSLWGTEADPVSHDLPNLTDAERALYNELRDNRIRRNLRLEQERIGFGFVQAVLTSLTG